MAETPYTGEVEKLVIKAYKTADYSGGPVAEFKVGFNPEEYVQVFDIEYNDTQGDGTTGSPMGFKRVKPQEYTLKFMIDGTGVSGEKIDVVDKIEEFFSVVGYDGDIHRPRYLQVLWGTLRSNCILLKAEITYKLFRSDGRPLRALLNASFKENVDDKTRVAKANDRSPDLTHVRTVKEGDTLPLMTYEVYGDFSPYIEVARFNRLKDFRRLTPGEKILFPPLEKVSDG